MKSYLPYSPLHFHSSAYISQYAHISSALHPSNILYVFNHPNPISYHTTLRLSSHSHIILASFSPCCLFKAIALLSLKTSVPKGLQPFFLSKLEAFLSVNDLSQLCFLCLSKLVALLSLKPVLLWFAALPVSQNLQPLLVS